MLAAAAPEHDCLALVKPQFEVGRERVGRGGVVRSGRRSPGGARGGGPSARASGWGCRARLRLLGAARARRQPRELRMAGRARPGGGRRRTWRPPRGAPSRERPAALGHGLHPYAARRRPAGARDGDPPGRGGGRGGAHSGGRGREARPGSAGGRGARRRPRRADRPRDRARRRRHDPLRAPALRRPRRAGLRRQLRGDRVPGDRREPRSSRKGSRRALAGELRRDARCPCWWPTPRPGEQLAVNDLSFHRRQDGRVAELGYRVRGHELGRGALRRAGGGHPGGLDRLQPRQRRAGARLGGGGVRGVVHRPAHAHRAGAGGGAGRRARGDQPLAGTRRWT